ncbi:hypothetical protein MTO96_038403 [Rhipicephalus appendiculatus]
MDATAPLGPLQQLKQPTASLMASRTEDIATEHWNASSTRPGTRTVADADAVAASAGSAPSTPTQLTTASPEDSMEDEDNEPSGWDTVKYRRYTTRRLKGVLRSQRQLLHYAKGTQIIIDGDFNAKSDIWDIPLLIAEDAFWLIN